MELVVDGIVSRLMDPVTYEDTVTVNEMFDFRMDHAPADITCHFCTGRQTWTSDSMRWSPGYPIIRFTSEGLQAP